MGGSSTQRRVGAGDISANFRALFREFEKVFQPGATGSSRAGITAARTTREELQLTRRFGRQFAQLEQRLNQQAIQRDPVARRLQQTAISGLEGQQQLQQTALSGLEDILQGNLPQDVRSRFTEDLRSSLAGRGLNQSGLGAVEEASGLARLREGIRGQRLGQAASILGGTTQPGLGLLDVPTVRRVSPLEGGPSQFGLNPQGIFSSLVGQNAGIAGQNLARGGQFFDQGLQSAQFLSKLFEVGGFG